MAVPSQIIGGATSTVAEVEAATKALRGTFRPEDYGSLGIYSVAGMSGLMAAALATDSPIFAFRWGTATSNLCALRRVRFTAAGDATAFTAGVAQFRMPLASAFTASASGGTSLTPAGNMNKLRTSMGTSLVTDIRIATTGALTPGTWVLTISTVTGSGSQNRLHGICSATAAKPIIGPVGDKDLKSCTLFEAAPGEYPLIFASNEGFVIQNSIAVFPATGTWRFSVQVLWEELAAFHTV